MPAATPTHAASALPPPQRRRRRRRRRESAASRFGPRVLTGAAGLACLLAALLLAWHYPLGALPAIAGVLLATLLARFFWTLWPGWMLGLLPWLGLAPWTGWMLVDEFDLLVLASAAGGYFAISGPHRQRPPEAVPVWRRELRWRRITLLAMSLSLLSCFMSVLHGMVDAGGFEADLFQGYLSAGEALRAGKPMLWMLLMLPLWQRLARRTPHTLTPALQAGMAAALWGVCAGVLYERLVQTELSDIGSGYRSSGGFWEMQFGGAALEAALALLLPFALLIALRQRRGLGFALSAALLMLGLYAALTTFSLMLYVAVALSLPLTLLLWAQQERRRLRGERDPASSWLPGQVLPDDLPPTLPPWQAALLLLALLAGAGVAAWAMYPSSGLRGLLALSGVVVALLAQPPAAAPAPRSRVFSSLLGLLLALPLVALMGLLASVVPKAAYAVYALAWLGSMSLARLAGRQRRPWYSPLGDALRAALWFALLGGVAVVAWSWAGEAALRASLLPLALVALGWLLCQSGGYGGLMQGLSWRTRLGAMAAMALIAGLVAALSGTTLAGDGLSGPEQRLAPRLKHWERTLTAITAEDGWVFGAGAGRFVAVFSLNAPSDEQIGSYALGDGPVPHLRLRAGRHPQGDADVLRLTQRIDAAPAGLQLQLQARHDEDVTLLVEVCRKQLLSAGACLRQRAVLPANPDGWRSHRIELGGSGELGSQGLQFAVALASRGQELMLAKLSLRGADGQELLRNGSFARGLAHWFPTSERHHLPWHADNLGLHLLFEQGVVGLVLGALLLGLALGRLLIGTAREHPLAPALAASLIAFLLLGIFDSLIDAPRIAFLFLTLLALGLGLRAPPPPPVKLPPSPSRPLA